MIFALDAKNDSDSGEGSHQRRTTSRNQRQRYTQNRQEPQDHCDVNHCLENDPKHDCAHDILAELIAGSVVNI